MLGKKHVTAHKRRVDLKAIFAYRFASEYSSINLDTFIFNQAGQLYQLCIRYMHTSVKHEEVCPVQIRDNSCNTYFASLIKGKGNHNAHLTAVH